MGADVAAQGLPGSWRIFGDSSMAALIRARDWSQTKLGAIEQWPVELVAAVNTILASPLPSQVFWGPEMILVYNDALLPFMSGKHPKVLGQPCRVAWKEAWPTVGEQLESVLTQGKPVTFNHVLLPILRNGAMEDFYWNYSYSPLMGADGRATGILNIAQDITAAVLAQQELKSAEAQAVRILRSIGDAVVVTDAEARVVRMNAVAEELTGWKEAEARGVPLPLVFHIVNETTRQIVESPADKVKRTGRVVGLANHTVLIAKDGRETQIDDSGAPIRDEEGKLTGIVLVFRGIEERRAAERERERVTEQLSQVLSATTDAVVSVNRDWVMTYMNPKAETMYGSREELVGKNLWEMFPDAALEGSPFLKAYTKAMNEGVSDEFETYYPEPLNFWLRLAVYPTRDGIVTFSRDISEEKRTQETMREKDERLRMALAATKSVGTWDWDVPNNRVYIGDESAALYSVDPKEAAKGLPSEDFIRDVHPDDVPGLSVAIADAMRSGEDYKHEYRLMQGDGSMRWVISTGLCRLAADGTPLRFSGVTVDVTERHLAQSALIQSEKLAAVGRLAASIAHEINNPLESVTNLLYLARNSGEISPEAKEYLDTADRELRRVSIISNQTLRFYKQSTRPKPVTSEDLFGSSISIFQGRLVNSRVQLEQRTQTQTPVLCFDNEIRQVLNNLIGNAIDAMHPDGGRLLLRSRDAHDWRTGEKGILLTVADSGPGISEPVLKRIFEAFFTTKGIGGTGLGLWVSQEIIERHHGRMRVRSSTSEQHHGTVFTLFLPAVARDRSIVRE